MKRKLVNGSLVVAALVSLTWALSMDNGDAANVTQEAGYVIHIDPATGNLVTDGSSGLALDSNELNGLSTSSQGLTEVQSPVSGGGTFVNLEGRFQSTQMATVDEDGELVAPCVSGVAVTDEDAEHGEDEE